MPLAIILNLVSICTFMHGGRSDFVLQKMCFEKYEMCYIMAGSEKAGYVKKVIEAGDKCVADSFLKTIRLSVSRK